MELLAKVKENKYVMKVVVLGDVGVGKTNIIRRILGEDFRELEATVGVEFTFLDITDADPEDPNKVLSIQIWDTSGAERYRAITINHIRNADGAYLVYDITNPTSFTSLDFWLDLLKQASEEDIVIYLVGNKADLVFDSNQRKVAKQAAINYSRLNHFQGFGECSAMKNINIKETFTAFYKTLYKKNKNKLEEKTQRKIVQLEKMKQEHSNQNKKCC